MKVNIFCPCLTFFSAGEFRMGLAALFMQLSLVMWPSAVRRAREFAQSRSMQRMLDELSQAHHHADATLTKRFKKAR